jgi:type II secretory pathway pseudopilin PulG
MEPGIALVVLVILGIPIALAIWLIVRAVSSRNRIEELSHRLGKLESEIFRLKREKESPKPFESSPATAPPQPKIVTPAPVEPPQPAVTPQPVISLPRPPVATPPPISVAATTPKSSPVFEPPRSPAPKINWEQFMGVKGFAWIGGLALFLGVAFFVKYSFDNNLVPPELRVAIGFLTGLGLLVGGVVMSRKNFPALSQTLCATGVVILYAVTFACRSIYHFEFFGPIPTFLLMALITTTAFFVAVRLNALVVAILGMLGGFITPILLSTGQDNPLGLFGYIAILDAGLIVVALHRRWYFLTALAALGTAIMQIGWAQKFFVNEKYFEGNKILVALGVLLGFNALWLAANWWAKRRDQINQWLSGSTLGLVVVALAFTAWFLDFTPLAQQPWLIFGFVFVIDLVAIAVTLLDKKISPAQSISGFAVFGLLAFWTSESLSNELLNAALAFYFIFAVVHSALPALLQRRRGITTQTWANHIFPILALALVLVPVFKLAEVSFVVWPFILLVDLLAIALAVLTATLLPVLAVLLLTLAATGALIFKIPSDLTGLPTSFFLLGAFVVFFVVAGIWLVKKFKPDALKTGIKFGNDLAAPGDLAAILPACSIVLPFLLLIMATLRLPLINPSPVFGLALLLVVLLFGVTKLFSLDWMPAVGLACVTALECAWHFNRFDPANPNQPLNLVLTWYLIFFAVFALFPFLFLRQFENKVVPWAAAAMAGLPKFFLIHRFISAVYPNQMMGLLPAAFAIPGLLSLVVILKQIPAETKSRMTQLAWFGGVALFFITLIFPIQFDRQWITIGWALEGAALLWLFHRVPHPGLRLTGVGLLAAAFVRLAFNPAVLEYHPRAATPIFNWYLYAYGIVTICLFAGTRLLAPPRNLVLKSNVPPILAGFGTVLAFLLLNIEIADYFSAPGSTLTFQFSGNFARDMTYSIAWALFALALLVYGILKKIPAARYAAMGLLCVTLVKLFFHDLAQLGQLYRIGAFIGVAVIAMLASFAYQKFFSAILKDKESKDEAPK